LSADFFNNNDIHLHVPAGATPKDGPSAGVTMATSLVSLISGRKVLPHVGMTGEITLRGQVLPIGGVKEKVLAAHRNGLRTVILPKRNKRDLEDVPDEIKKSMKFVFAETVEDVLNASLEKAKPPVKSAAKKKTTKAKSKTNEKSSSG
jgi:ATP-dependent Lon protease